MTDTMQDQRFDDGLVHAHAWAGEPPAPCERDRFPIAETSLLGTPSTVHHDEVVFAA